MNRRDLNFQSHGVRCAATLFAPDDLGDRLLPAIAMAHGTGAVKDMNLPDFARVFADAGFAVLTFDYRHLGLSDGSPRHQVFPEQQRADYHAAITTLAEMDGVDPERIGIWGTSGSGAHVLQVAAFDRRVKAVVSQVAGIAPYRIVRQAFPPEARAMFEALIAEERVRVHHGTAHRALPHAAPADEPSVFGPVDLSWFEDAKRKAPSFGGQLTILSIDALLQSSPEAFIDAIAPTPLLMIVTDNDAVTPANIIAEAFARAGEPKKLLRLSGGHYDVYDDPETFAEACGAARDWFLQYLVDERAEQPA